MNSVMRRIGLALIMAGLVACSDNSSTQGKLTLTGSSTVAALAAEIGKRFEALHPGLRVDVQSGGSARGITDAREGLVDIGMVSRALKPEENDLQAVTIARDGVGMIVHKTNPVRALSSAQIVAIYTGTIRNWKEVGGADAPITVVNKAEGRSTLELFTQYFKLKNSDIKAHVVIGDNEQGVKSVAGNPNAIGYVSIGTAEYDASQGAMIKLLPLAGIAASTENVRNGSFPLSRPLNLVTSTKPENMVKDFIDFARSAEVSAIVREQFFVPITQ